MWRVFVGLHKKISISFLPVGHTKFSPDWCFGLLKQRFRRCQVNCLEDLVRVVNESAVVNKAQLVGTQYGESVVPIFDWTTFLNAYMTKIPSITKKHYFMFCHENPGTVNTKECTNGAEKDFDLLRDPSCTPSSSSELPPRIEPRGLTNERQWYLYESIREYCSVESRDQVCPLPRSPKSSSNVSTHLPTLSQSPSPTPSSPDTFHPPAKRQRVCGSCGQYGHNRRTCKNNN